MKDDVITMHAAVDGGADSMSPSHKNAQSWKDNVNRLRKQDEVQKNKHKPAPRFKKETPTERWWNKLKTKKQNPNPSSPTPAQNVQSQQPTPSPSADPEFSDLWSRMPTVDPNYTPKPKTNPGGGTQFDPNDPTITGQRMRPFLESLKGSLDAHRKKYLQYLLDVVDDFKAKGDMEGAEDATRNMLMWIEGQRINQKTLNQIHYFLEQTTPKDKESPYDVPVQHGQYPVPGSDPDDLSQPTTFSKGKGQIDPAVKQMAEKAVQSAGGDYDKAIEATKTDMAGAEGNELEFLKKVQTAIGEMKQYVSKGIAGAAPKETKTLAEDYLQKNQGDYDKAIVAVDAKLQEPTIKFDDKRHLDMVRQYLISMRNMSSNQAPQLARPGVTPPAPAPVAPPAAPVPPPQAPSGTTIAPQAPVTMATPVQPQQPQPETTGQPNWWEEMKKGGRRTAQSENLKSTYELTYVLAVLASLGYNVADKEAVKKILAYNIRHGLAASLDRIPDEQWTNFISTLGKPGAANKDLMQNRPRWWGGAPTTPPRTKEDKWREDWGLGADAPYTPITPGKPPSDKISPEPWEEPQTMEDWVYYGVDEDEDINKQGQSGDGMFSWLYWMAEAGFDINNYATMQHLAKLFPQNLGAQSASQFPEDEYKKLLASSAIAEYGEPLKEHYEKTKEPEPLPPTQKQLEPKPKPKKTYSPVPEDAWVATDQPPPEPEPVYDPSKPLMQGPGRKPVGPSEFGPMPGFKLGMPCLDTKGKPILIAIGGKRNSTKSWEYVPATVGMGVFGGAGIGRGYVVGVHGQDLAVWLEKNKTVRLFSPTAIEQDMGKKFKTGELLSLVRKVRAQQTPTPNPGQPVQTQTQQNPAPPGVPRGPGGENAKPGDLITPLPNTPTIQTPDNSGTVTTVNQDGSIQFTDQTGKPKYNAPGEPASIVPNPGGNPSGATPS